jgi:hypothetical protein
MELKADDSQEALGLRLVRAYLTLPPEKRQRVLQFVEEMTREQGQSSEGAEASST